MLRVPHDRKVFVFALFARQEMPRLALGCSVIMSQKSLYVKLAIGAVQVKIPFIDELKQASACIWSSSDGYTLSLSPEAQRLHIRGERAYA